MSHYIRYRFKTKSVDDPRPLKDLKPIGMPFWISGYSSDNDFNLSAAIIICYLPKDENLKDYWDDAFEILQPEIFVCLSCRDNARQMLAIKNFAKEVNVKIDLEMSLPPREEK